MLETHGPLELLAQERITPGGVAIRVAPPHAGALQWADVWVTLEDVIRWVHDIADAQKRQKLGRQMLRGMTSSPPDDDRETIQPGDYRYYRQPGGGPG